MSEIFIALAVWRITSLVVHETGPFDVFKRFRDYLKEFWYVKSLCFWCVSVWVGFFFALIFNLNYLFLPYLLGYSAFAIIVEEVISFLQPVIVEQAQPHE